MRRRSCSSGAVHDAAVLEQVIGRLRFGQRLDRGGDARFWRWRLYEEPGLAPNGRGAFGNAA